MSFCGPGGSRSKKCRTLGILTTPQKDIFNSNYHLSLLSGIIPRIKRAKCRLKIIMMPAQPYRNLDEILCKHQLDGLLILTWRWIHPSIVRLIETSRNAHVLVVNDPVPGLRVNVVSTDAHAGMAQAVAHLVKKGFRRIGMLHGPLEVPFKVNGKKVFVPFIDTRIKEKGFMSALRSKKMPVRPSWVRSTKANSVTEGCRVMDRWLKEKQLPDAVICGNDDLAFGAIRAIRAAGLKCPGDIAVVGFDDNDLAKSFNPPLTTIRQPLKQIGEDAVRILLRASSKPVRKTYRPELIVRKTT